MIYYYNVEIVYCWLKKKKIGVFDILKYVNIILSNVFGSLFLTEMLYKRNKYKHYIII